MDTSAAVFKMKLLRNYKVSKVALVSLFVLLASCSSGDTATEEETVDSAVEAESSESETAVGEEPNSSEQLVGFDWVSVFGEAGPTDIASVISTAPGVETVESYVEELARIETNFPDVVGQHPEFLAELSPIFESEIYLPDDAQIAGIQLEHSFDGETLADARLNGSYMFVTGEPFDSVVDSIGNSEEFDSVEPNGPRGSASFTLGSSLGDASAAISVVEVFPAGETTIVRVVAPLLQFDLDRDDFASLPASQELGSLPANPAIAGLLPVPENGTISGWSISVGESAPALVVASAEAGLPFNVSSNIDFGFTIEYGSASPTFKENVIATAQGLDLEFVEAPNDVQISGAGIDSATYSDRQFTDDPGDLFFRDSVEGSPVEIS